MTIYESSSPEQSQVMINNFVLQTCFNTVFDDAGQKVYWLETKDHDGYVLIWPSGESFHTYRKPDEWLSVN